MSKYKQISDGIFPDIKNNPSFYNRYRIVPNRCAVHEWEGLGVRLLISQKWVECDHPLYRPL